MGGDVARAWQHHPWVVLAVAQLVVLSALVLSGVRLPRERVVPPLLVVNAAAGMLIWCVRLAAGMIPVPFG